MKSNNEDLLTENEGLIKVFALTGSRSEYDLFYPLLHTLELDPDFDLSVIVCGAHLTSLHDYTVKQIELDGFRIVDKIDSLLFSNSTGGKVKSIGILLQGLAQTLERERPDLLLVLGDREETIIGSLAGCYMRIPVVHLAGGDNTFPIGGDVDEEVRHAATKLSHVHLTMADEHTKRIINLGEEAWRVFTVGSGGIDRLRQEDGLDRNELAALLGPAIQQDYVVVIYHAMSSEVNLAADNMRNILAACLSVGCEIFVGAPNSDPGFEDIQRVIDEHKHQPAIHFYRNIPRLAFTSLLRHARCLVGNSSLALHEAPFLGLPAVNVGERQRGRLAGNNVVFVSNDYEDVLVAVKRAVYNTDYRQGIQPGESPYGDGRMAERTVAILKSLPSSQVLLAKRITY